MWIAKIKLNGQKSLLGSRCKKFNVSWRGYPLSIDKDNKNLKIYFIGFVFGSEQNKKAFVKDLRSDDRMIYLESNQKFMIGKFQEPIRHYSAYHYKFFHLDPMFIGENGMELWTIGSWERDKIIDFVNLVEKTHLGELLSIKENLRSGVSIISAHPELTSQQRKAVELAALNGYYEYPRRATLNKLAKMANLSFSTYQAHLRKLIPFGVDTLRKTVQ